MDYLFAKLGNFSFSRFGFTVRTDRQTGRQNHTQTRMIAILTRHNFFLDQCRTLHTLLFNCIIKF